MSKTEETKMYFDSMGKPIEVGDRVLFRGEPYTIKYIFPGNGRSGIATLQFVERRHVIDEVPDEWSVDLIDEQAKSKL